MTTVDHNLDLAAIRAELDCTEWEADFESDQEVRRCYLGTVFSLTPSGKFYTPFACSNVTPCQFCKGNGEVVARRYKRRVQKRHASRHTRIMRQWRTRFGAPTGLYGRALTKQEITAKAWLLAKPARYRHVYSGALSLGTACKACGGCGSREAYLDEVWHEVAEEALRDLGLTLESDEGDDIHAVEYRDTLVGEDNES